MPGLFEFVYALPAGDQFSEYKPKGFSMLRALTLLMFANGAPVIAKRIFGRRFNWPLDGGMVFLDGKPLVGPSKTWRGVIAAILVTTFGATTVGFRPRVGLAVALGGNGRGFVFQLR